MTQFIEMIRKNSHRRDEPWKRIIDPFHEDDEEFSREQRDVEIEQNEVFKRYDIISKEIRTIGKGKPQMLHLDVSMEIATKYNLYVLIGNMSEEDNYVLIVGNKRVTLKPFDAIIMNASVYHAGSGDAHASRMYLLYSYSPLTQKQITEIKKSAEDLWYLPTGDDTPEYAGNCTGDTKVENNELCSRESLIAISAAGACSSSEYHPTRQMLNSKNSCYINSTFQMVAAIPGFPEHIRTMEETWNSAASIGGSSSSDAPLLAGLRTLLTADLNKPSARSLGPMDLTVLRKHFKAPFLANEQEYAEEFLTYIFDYRETACGYEPFTAWRDILQRRGHEFHTVRQVR